MSKHADTAGRLLAGVVDGNDRGYVKLLRAQAEATLAVAYAQDTASLVALWTAPGSASDGQYNKGEELAGVSYGLIADRIKERLGLA